MEIYGFHSKIAAGVMKKFQDNFDKTSLNEAFLITTSTYVGFLLLPPHAFLFVLPFPSLCFLYAG